MFSLKEKLQTKDRAIWLRLVTLILGVEWLRAGLEKVLNPEFSSGLNKTLGFFASKNPSNFFVGLINSYFIPNSEVFAMLVSWGEVFVGLALIIGFFVNFSLIIAIFMNLNFYFAAGWTGVSTAGLNALMILIQLILIFSYGSKLISLDELLVAKWPATKRLFLSKK